MNILDEQYITNIKINKNIANQLRKEVKELQKKQQQAENDITTIKENLQMVANASNITIKEHT